MAFIKSFLDALVAIPKIVSYVEAIAAGVSAWYIARQKTEVLKNIQDAAALAIRAKTTEERFQAAAKWQEVLDSKRYIK